MRLRSCERTPATPANLAMPQPVSQLAHVLGPRDCAAHRHAAPAAAARSAPTPLSGAPACPVGRPTDGCRCPTGKYWPSPHKRCESAHGICIMRCTKVHIVSRFKFKYKFEFYLRPATRTREDREKCGLSCTVRKQFVHTSNPVCRSPQTGSRPCQAGGRAAGAAGRRPTAAATRMPFLTHPGARALVAGRCRKCADLGVLTFDGWPFCSVRGAPAAQRPPRVLPPRACRGAQRRQ